MYLLSLLLLSFTSIHANSDLAENTAKYLVYCKNKQWSVEHDGRQHAIQRAFVDKVLRDMPEDKAEEALTHFALRIAQMDNGQYSLHAHARGLGGGPLTASFLYWTTKTLWYGTAAAAAGTAVVATGGAAAGAAAALANAGAAAAVAGGAGVMAGNAAMVGVAAGGAGVATAETVGAMAAMASAGGGFVAAGETLALGAGAVGAACWFLP